MLWAGSEGWGRQVVEVMLCRLVRGMMGADRGWGYTMQSSFPAQLKDVEVVRFEKAGYPGWRFLDTWATPPVVGTCAEAYCGPTSVVCDDAGRVVGTISPD